MDKIGRYRLEGRIGAGSFATVWRGHDDELAVPVAVKVLADNWAGNEDVRSRFLAEARIMRRIHDRRLVQVYDIGTLDDGRPYFVMDYVDGGSLNDLRLIGVAPVRALRLCAEACRALEVLHANDIIHRDVTPGNLLLTRDADGSERVLVADLGVAKSLVDAAGATMTAGTPSYMAPEQAGGSVPLDRRADVYSLTAVTYAMLTGKAPFPVTSISDLLTRDPDQPPAPVADRVGAPPSLDAVLVSGLAFDRQRRPPTALLLADGLETIARQIEAASPVSPLPGPPSMSPYSSPVSGVAPRSAGSAGSSDSVLTTAMTPPNAPPAIESPYSAPPREAAPHVMAGAPPLPTVAPVPAPPEISPVFERTDPDLGSGRRRGYYVLLSALALVLFAVSMLVTILLIR